MANDLNDPDRQARFKASATNMTVQPAKGQYQSLDTGVVAKARQGIGLSPSDNAHTTTHEPDPSVGTDNLGN